MAFPKDFLWGAATASYQIEGAANEDAKGLSVWDNFTRQPDRIFENQNGDVACDHYHRYQEDVALMREMKLQAYRFSVAWPRILPNGTGAVNPKGLDFYDKLTDELLKANIQPWVTLFHWDFPYELYCRGGWLNRDSSDWFAEYTQVVVDRLGDRVKNWMTLNEPQCFMLLGHQIGMHAPGDKLGWHEILRGAHNVLLAHGKAVQVIRAHSKVETKIGFAPVGGPSIPASQSAEDIEAAKNVTFGITEKSLWGPTWWADPVILGHYPADGLQIFGKAMPDYPDSDMKTICQPLDFYGTNIYSSETVRAGSDGKPQKVETAAGYPRTAFNWKVTPASLYWGPRFYYERYKLPIVITENGLANIDWVSLDGKVHDPQRIDFTTRYLSEYKRAIEDGIPALGYFHWSLMDNFEWQEGYKQRFGMVYVDYQTQKRIPKDSAAWYKDVIESNGAILDGIQGSFLK